MKLPHLHHREHDEHGHTTEQALDDAGYDAQSDLALPSHETGHVDDAFVPFAGELAPAREAAAYDALRDTGVDP